MKVAFLVNSEPIRKVLEQVCTTLTGAELAEPSSADAVVCDQPRDMLAYLKAGKRVAQFIWNWQSQQAAVGLRESYPGRFDIFGVIEKEGEYKGSLALYAFVAGREVV